MEASIPFHDGLSLGRSLDVTKYPFKHGPLLVPEDTKTNDFPVNLITPQFCVTNNIDDVSTVLQLPLAYVLKVEANLIKDDVVTSCLRDVGNEDTVSVIFRLSFLQQKQYLPQTTQLNLDALKTSNGEQPQSASTETIKDQSVSASIDMVTDQLQSASVDATEDEPQASSSTGLESQPLESKPCKTIGSATHWVKALEVGNELIVICRISSPEREDVDSTFRKLTECLGCYRGLLEARQMSDLEEFAKKIDKKLKKKQYSHMKLSIEYCSFLDLQLCPANLTDMVNVMKEFLRKCEAWTSIYKQTLPFMFNKEPMIWKKGSLLPRDKGVLKKVSDFISNNPEDLPMQYFNVPHFSSEVDNGEGDSIEVLASESDCVHYLRAIVQTFESEDLEAFDIVQNPRTHENKLRCLHEFFLCNVKAIEKLQRFLASGHFISETLEEEGKKMLKALYVTQLKIVEVITGLDFVTVPTDEEWQALVDSNSGQLVHDYIEKVTSKLPAGLDLDLLIIGKTGHGKSSTGNSILGEQKFEASASGESVTTSCGVGWARVDERTIKVVDTPGVCDTRADSDQSSTDVAIQGISDAIAHCPEGFHALLLVIRFGQRMTSEERKAIGMLKCILGEDIIKTHCVCVVTHGDNFRLEMKGQKTFKTWCQEQSGFMKDIFEECQYRCVLFDNKNDSLKFKKRQVIELVTQVDCLSKNGLRYTNSLFEFALNERKKAIDADKAPEVDERITRDIQLVLGHLDKMIKGSDEGETFEADLDSLKYTVDNLKNDVKNIKGSNLDNLVETVFALAQAVHEKIDNNSQKAVTDSPQEGASGGASANCERTPKAVETPASSQDSSSRAKADLKILRGDLQGAQETIDSKAEKVNKQVANGVKAKVKEGKECFPGSSWVIVKDGQLRTMSDLKIGDEILARNAEGRLMYETVYMFGHRDKNKNTDFFVFETKHHRVMVSHDHLVYCAQNGSEVCLPASLVREGDELITVLSSGLVRQPVLCVSQEKQQGLYAPFTNSGTLIVNGVLMSCYVDVLPPAKAHALLKPIRKLYQISPATLELINGSKRGNVVPAWAKLFLKLKIDH